MTIARLSTAAFAVLMLGGAPAGAKAQNPKAANPKPPTHEHGQQGMSCMADGMGGSHHAMSMAYWANLATFARTMKEQIAQTKTVDVEMARPAVAEMRRSFDAIKQHHQAHTAMMGAADSAKLRMMGHMDSAMASLGEDLTALEAEVNTASPDPAKVTERANAILKHCGGTAMHPAPSRHHP